MTTLNLVQLEGVPIFQQLQLEEALLRADHGNWCIINSQAPPAIVLGISGDPKLFINQTHFARDPVPVVRRFSGGGTVIVDEDTLFVTFIFNSAAAQISCSPRSVLQWVGEHYHPLFPKGEFQIRENDYTLGNRKFGGNAQYFCKERWLHHTTLLWDYSPQRMQNLAMPPRMPAYREQRSHEDFLCRIKEYHPEKNLFFDRFRALLGKRYRIEEVSIERLNEIKARSHRKSTAAVLLTTKLVTGDDPVTSFVVKK